MIGRRGHRIDLGIDMGPLNVALDRIAAEPVRLDEALLEVLDELGATPCRVRPYSVILPHGVSTPAAPPCGNLAAFEVFCRVCGHGGTCCAEHEREIMADPEIMCHRCQYVGTGAQLFAFVPLGP